MSEGSADSVKYAMVCMCVCAWRYWQVMYWAVDAECCEEGATSTCEGWDQEDWEGINWFKTERPATVFMSHKFLDQADIYRVVGTTSFQTAPVVLEWRRNAAADVAKLFDAPAWTWLVVVTLLWPLVLCLLWTALTLGSCLFLPRSPARPSFAPCSLGRACSPPCGQCTGHGGWGCW